MVQYLGNSNDHFKRKFIGCRAICLLVSLENTKLLTKILKSFHFLKYIQLNILCL